MSESLSPHIEEVSEGIRDKEPNQAEDCRTRSDSVLFWRYYCREEISSEATQEVQEEHFEEANAILDTDAKEKLDDHVSGQVF